jgi:ATP-dependent Clp protease, protease subunit
MSTHPRIIVFSGEVEIESISNFMREFTALDSEPGPIEIRIYSNGGDSTGGMALYDMVRASNNHITTVAYGDVSSIAIVIFQAGDRRVAAPNCVFLFHPTSAHVEGNVKQLSSIVKETNRTHNRMCRILSERSGMQYKEVQKLCSTEQFRTSRQVLKMGFADYILGSFSEEESRLTTPSNLGEDGTEE